MFVALLLFGFLSVCALSQATKAGSQTSANSALQYQIGKLRAQIADARSSADNSWMLVNSACADNDGARSGSFLWRTGSEVERSFYNDAKFCNDNCLVQANCEVHRGTSNQLCGRLRCQVSTLWKVFLF